MQYAPTLTDQKFDFHLSIKSSTRYVVGRMQYASTKTWYVSIKYVFIESFSCQEFDSLSFIESYTRQKLDSPLKPLTHNDPFSIYRCRGVWHTPHKCPWQWANDSSTRYVSVKYVFVESYTRQKFDYLSFIESYTRQKLNSPLKPPVHSDPFFMYRRRGVWHTPHKSPWPWANDSSARYVSIEYVLIESFSRQGLDSPSPIESYTRQKLDSPLKPLTHNDPFLVYRCRGVWHTPHKCPLQWANDSSSLYIVGRMQYAPTKTWYVSIKYVLIESFSCQEFDSLFFIESYTR